MSDSFVENGLNDWTWKNLLVTPAHRRYDYLVHASVVNWFKTLIDIRKKGCITEFFCQKKCNCSNLCNFVLLGLILNCYPGFTNEMCCMYNPVW